MSKLFHPLLVLIASATDQELARHMQYLKEENRVLRDKLPKRVSGCSAARNPRTIAPARPRFGHWTTFNNRLPKNFRVVSVF
jgi:hypothetical protein